MSANGTDIRMLTDAVDARILLVVTGRPMDRVCGARLQRAHTYLQDRGVRRFSDTIN